jgi:hypothetical protein
LIWHVLQGFWYRFYIDAKVYEEELARRAMAAGSRKAKEVG